MNNSITKWSRRYQAALRRHLKQGQSVSLRATVRLGRQAVILGVKVLNLALIHEQALAPLVSSGSSSKARWKIIGRAKRFLAETIFTSQKAIKDGFNNEIVSTP